jgi:hypothetical protein
MAKVKDKKEKGYDIENIKKQIVDLPKNAFNIPIRAFNKLSSAILPKNKSRNNEKILYYLRIYTYLVNAYDFLTYDKYQKSFNHLHVLKNLTKECTYREEKSYVNIISDIVKEINSNKDEIIRRLSEYHASDPAHSRTKLQLAQNMCIMRILKLS